MATSDFPIDIAQLVGMFMASVFYGIFLVTFFKCIRVLFVTSEGQLKSPRDLNWKMLIPAVLMFIFASLDVSFGLRHNIEAFIYFQGDPKVDFEDSSNWLVYMKMVNYVAQTFIGDAILIYRCWIIYSRKWYIIVPSVTLWLGTTACGIVTCYLEAKLANNAALVNAKDIKPFITGMLSLTLTTNLITTSLIVHRIWSIQREAIYRSPQSIADRSPLDRVLRLMIESGLLYTSSIIILFGLFLSSNNGEFGVSNAVVQIIGITFNLIIVRVDRGHAIQPKTSVYPQSQNNIGLQSIHVQTTISRFPEAESRVSPHGFKHMDSESPDRMEWATKV